MNCNIDNLTYGQIKELAALFNSSAPSVSGGSINPMVGKHCVVRTYSAGVHIGTVKAVDGMEVVLTNARRLWSWAGAFSLHEVADNGVAKESKASKEVDQIYLTQAIEFIPTTEKARKTYENCTQK